MSTTVSRFSFAAVIAVLLAFASFASSSAMASTPAPAKGSAASTAVTKFTMGVTDRNGNVRVVTLGDRTGRAETLRKNGFSDCVYLPSAIGAFSATGSPWLALRAGLMARGCGLWLADSICWTSRQWFGGAARWVVYQATRGRYDRC